VIHDNSSLKTIVTALTIILMPSFKGPDLIKCRVFRIDILGDSACL
jgi:hypothetical protein